MRDVTRADSSQSRGLPPPIAWMKQGEEARPGSTTASEGHRRQKVEAHFQGSLFFPNGVKEQRSLGTRSH